MRGWRKVAVAGLVGVAIASGTAAADRGPAVHARRGIRRRAAIVMHTRGPTFDPCLLAEPPPLPALSSPWVRVGGFKSKAPTTSRSEGGLTLALSRGLAVQLHYERTAEAPMMRHDHDDGFLTRLRLAF